MSPPAGAPAPWRDDAPTMTCPVCAAPFARAGRRRFCSDRCRRTAWTRRHQPNAPAVAVPARGRAAGAMTVYECASCGERAVGTQRCPDCHTFMTRIGWGGQCPSCGDPVAVAELFDISVVLTQGH